MGVGVMFFSSVVNTAVSRLLFRSGKKPILSLCRQMLGICLPMSTRLPGSCALTGFVVWRIFFPPVGLALDRPGCRVGNRFTNYESGVSSYRSLDLRSIGCKPAVRGRNVGERQNKRNVSQVRGFHNFRSRSQGLPALWSFT